MPANPVDLPAKVTRFVAMIVKEIKKILLISKAVHQTPVYLFSRSTAYAIVTVTSPTQKAMPL